MKTLLSILVLGLATSVLAQGFVDESDFPTWASEAIEVVNDEGIMTGYGDGTFGPDRSLTRAEAVTLILRIKLNIEDNYNGVPQFPDIVQGAWYDRAVGIAANNGWVKGHDDGNFYPGNHLTRAEFAAMMQRAFDLETDSPAASLKYDDVIASHWFAADVSAMLENELLRNALNLSFNPGNEVTRAEAAWTFAQLLSKPGLLGDDTEASYDVTDPLDSRRVAVKPRDFDANDQGYEIEKAAIHVEATPTSPTTPIAFAMDSDWSQLGLVRFRNSFDYRADLESLRLRLRLDATDMGPEEGFMLRIEGGGILFEKKVYSNGELALTGLEYGMAADDELVLKISIKADVTESFYSKKATGKVFVTQASGEAFKPLISTSRERSVRMAPIEYGDRDLSKFEFDPAIIPAE